MFTKDDLIYTYSRKQAITDGVQGLLPDKLSQEAGYKHPVYATQGVFNLVSKAVENKKHHNDFNGVVWDILWMSRFAARETGFFTVTITGTGKKRLHILKIECGAMDFDDESPVLTISLQGED